MSTAIRTRPFTVEEFRRIGEAGILTEDDRVELIHGEIIPMTPIGPRHAACVNALTRMLIQRVRPEVIVHIQNPLQLDRHTEVYPDLVVLRPRPDRYQEKIPEPDDVLLLIEVADTTLAKDQTEKLPHYAQVGVPEVWIIDVVKKEIMAHWDPSGQHYKNTSSSVHSTPMTSHSLSDLTITADEIFS